MHSYFSLIHTAQPRSRFSAQNFSSLRSRNTARNLCLVLRSFFRFVSTGASLGHFLPRFRTCVSVHRRDRCTRTPFLPTLHILVPVSLFGFILLFFSSVLVCLSIDVTGALVLFLFLPCLLPVSLLLSLFWLFSCTCVSVHRRDRCSCTPHTSGLPFAVLFVLLFLLLWLWVVVLGFLFTDVTGAPASC